MTIEEVQTLISAGQFYESQHAKNEREADDLTLAEVEQAIGSGRILESYPDTGRGESCLVAGFAGETPVHVVCARSAHQPGALVLVTVYIPKPPKFTDLWTRSNP